MLIGEGPGQAEDEQGLAFVGPAGQLLTRMLSAVGICREKVYIANIVKCRPPHNADPLPEYAECCLPFLRAQVAFIRPRLIVCLGKVPTRFLLHEEGSMGALHGKMITKGKITFMPTYHPSALLHNEDLKRPAWEDFKKIRSFINDD
jgi:DNA polymerase